MNKIEELKLELEKMREDHRAMSLQYGSELCAGDMISQEKKLEDKIEFLIKNEIK